MRTVNSGLGEVLPWAPDELVQHWIDLRRELPWLSMRPYFVGNEQAAGLLKELESIGFRVVTLDFLTGSGDPENELLTGLARSLDFNLLGAGNWPAFADRMFDLKRLDESALAIVIYGLGSLAVQDLHAFTRCVANLLTITDGLGAQDAAARRQIEYFFVGSWNSQSSDPD